MIKKILKNNKTNNMLIYSISYVLNKSSMYLLLPIYTRALSVELFGKFELLNTIFSLLLPLGLFGLNSAVLRFFKTNNPDYNKKVFKIIGDLYKFSILFYIVGGGLIYVVNQTIFNSSIIILVFFISRLIIDGADNIYKYRLRIEGKEKLYLFLDLIKFIFAIVLTLLLLKTLENKFIAVLLSISFSSIVSSGCYFKKYFKLKKYDSDKLKKEIFFYSLPLSFNSIANWIFSLSDKFLINIYLGSSALGLYGAGFKLGAISQLAISGFGMIWPKWAIAIYNSKEIKEKKEEKLEKITAVYLISTIFLYLILYYLLKMIYPFFYESSYQQSFIVVPFIIISFFILGLDRITSIGIFYEKKSKYTLLTTLLAATINVFLNIFFLRKYGYVFAAISTYISNLGLLLIRAIISYNLFPIKYRIRTFILFMLLNLVFIITVL